MKGESDAIVSVEAASMDFSSDNVKVTLRMPDANNLKYTTSEGETGSFTRMETSSPLVTACPWARPLQSP